MLIQSTIRSKFQNTVQVLLGSEGKEFSFSEIKVKPEQASDSMDSAGSRDSETGIEVAAKGSQLHTAVVKVAVILFCLAQLPIEYKDSWSSSSLYQDRKSRPNSQSDLGVLVSVYQSEPLLVQAAKVR